MNTTYYVAGIPYSAELYHHGIKGQKWGVRRYQNDDGTLTSAGRERYGMRDMASDMGFGEKGHLNSTQKHLSRYASSYANAALRKYNKAEKMQQKGKDNSKVMKKAENLEKNASYYRDMGIKYASLPKGEQMRINRDILRYKAYAPVVSGLLFGPIGGSLAGGIMEIKADNKLRKRLG